MKRTATRRMFFENLEDRRLLAADLVADLYTTAEDSAIVVQPKDGVMANDTDVRHVVLESDVAHGKLILNKNGSFGYQPEPDFDGEDSFVYKDMYSEATATVTITVTPSEDLATDDNYSTHHDTALHVPKEEGLLSNDDASYKIVSLLEGATNGHVILQPRGSFTYQPAEGFAGLDTFSYIAIGPNGSDVATVTIEVTNTAPVAVADSYEVVEDNVLEVEADQGLKINDYDDDGDWFTIEIVEQPTNGTLQLNGNNGAFTYTPNQDYFGTDDFAYRVFDGVDYSTSVPVNITITPVNDAPMAVHDEYHILSVDVLTGNVTTNDYDVDNSKEELTVVNMTEPDRGTLIWDADGSFTYQPDPNPGSDYTTVFEYALDDNSGGISLASVTITVYAITATDDNFEMMENTSLFGSVAGNDTYPEDFKFVLSTAPENGEVILDDDGSFVYTPEADYVGPNAFMYSLTNGELEEPIYGSVSITVRPDVITNALYTDEGFQNSEQINEGDLEKAAAATQSMGNAILEAVASTGAMDDQVITVQELFDLNYHLIANYVNTEAGVPIWVNGAGQQVARDLTLADHYYVGAWGDWHGDDANGRLLYGYTGEPIEHGYHLVQNDGGTTQYDNENLWTTVADGIYHMGNDIVYTDANGDLQFADEGYIEGVDYYFLLNEDGDQNASLNDVADWLTSLLTY